MRGFVLFSTSCEELPRRNYLPTQLLSLEVKKILHVTLPIELDATLSQLCSHVLAKQDDSRKNVW
ncbi:CLUMA_CG001524, isoform A [Clunio marinus]|uniref:CLUMA_CG001524, isoform A n=1 Tax=Clunio marinus TaxID=568069 RepID=A0A1J1HMP2_9DIPT|nr:CLUMA_CG001524, isoform A [Clunio marinus]